MRILIIEDNLAIATNLHDFLESSGHGVESVRDGISGLRAARSQAFDVILLDLGLPGMDGVEVCRCLREESRIDTPILMLTARDTLADKLSGFAIGADDYLVKPFALEEVLVRLLALHKRSAGKTVRRKLEAGDLSYDPDQLRVLFAGQEVVLQPKCLALLELLMREPGRVLSRRELELELWGDEQETSDRLRNHVSLLRRALLSAGGRDPVKTVHGIGFRLAVDT